MKGHSMNLKIWVFLLWFFILGCIYSQAGEYHVSVNGNDDADGSAAHPFKTISAASRVARAGDTITVHAGTYHEWVDPPYGGTSNLNRIVYRAAGGEKVIIKGSEVVKGWENIKKGVWKVTLNNTLFGDYNPYRELVSGDWFLNFGRNHHTGEVYLNGKSFYEIDSLEKVINPLPLKGALDQEGSLYQWYCETDSKSTTIWANFHESDPNMGLVEINVRPTVFFPKNTGINYITVNGFILTQAATNWAPPSAVQWGLIGPNWSKGWIIENNTISHSKCSGISLGTHNSMYDNFPVILSVPDFAISEMSNIRLPVKTENNLYLNGAVPFKNGINEKVMNNSYINLWVEEKEDGTYLFLKANCDFSKTQSKIISSFSFGEALVPGVVFDTDDGFPVLFNSDYFNESRERNKNIAGPFTKIVSGDNKIRVWPK